MKVLLQLFLLLLILFAVFSCGDAAEHDEEGSHAHEEENGTHEEEGIFLTLKQVETMDLAIGEMEVRDIFSTVHVNGQLEVPPQNEARVTATIGGNIASIEVIEGDKVNKGQVLAYVSHPDLIKLQSNFIESAARLQFLEAEFKRQKTLYDEEITSGKNFQDARSRYFEALSEKNSLESQLRQLGINPSIVSKGNFITNVPIKSPINGFIVEVEVKTGEFVAPEKDLFEIVNTDHIHADFMVFEKDIFKVKKGQRVRFTVESWAESELFAEIYSVGKQFEQEPKAVHVHAEIENKTNNLIAGMYIKGEIYTESEKSKALPEEAVVAEQADFFVFAARRDTVDGHAGWYFTPTQVRVKTAYKGWVGVVPLATNPDNQLFALNNSYYLMAELKKGEAEHDH